MSDEATEGLSCWLIRRAARCAPRALAGRLEEEWLADLAERPSAASRLRFAIGCCWATRVIAHEHLTAAALPVTPALDAKSVLAYAEDHVGGFSRRTLAVGFVVCLHIAVFYALMAGLSNTLTKVNEPPLENRDIREVHARDLPPLPPPNLNPVHLDVPPLDPGSLGISDRNPDGIQATEPPPSPFTSGTAPEPLPPAHVARRVQGGPGVGFPNPDDYYPDLAKRLDEHGVATVQVCVDAHGRLTSDPTTLEGSGSARLDQGALKLARAGSGHYRATTEDGKAVSSCYPLRVRFQLRN